VRTQLYSLIREGIGGRGLVAAVIGKARNARLLAEEIYDSIG
jgi:hypothetical protein